MTDGSRGRFITHTRCVLPAPFKEYGLSHKKVRTIFRYALFFIGERISRSEISMPLGEFVIRERAQPGHEVAGHCPV